MQNVNTSVYSDLPTVLNANQLAKTLGISRSGAYNLLASRGFPTLHIGNRKLVPKEKLIKWIDANTKEYYNLFSVQSLYRINKINIIKKNRANAVY